MPRADVYNYGCYLNHAIYEAHDSMSWIESYGAIVCRYTRLITQLLDGIWVALSGCNECLTYQNIKNSIIMLWRHSEARIWARNNHGSVHEKWTGRRSPVVSALDLRPPGREFEARSVSRGRFKTHLIPQASFVSWYNLPGSKGRKALYISFKRLV